MAWKHCIVAFILVPLNLVHFTLGFTAYEGKHTTLINNLRRLVKMAAKEQVQATGK